MEQKYTGTQAQEDFVAKTFVGWEILSEPTPNDKGALYMNVRNPKTNAVRNVRFYAPKTAITKVTATPVYNPNARNMAYPFGFCAKGETTGSITLYTNTGDYEEVKDFFTSCGCRWNKWFHWYAPYNVSIPAEELPEGAHAITLNYSQISDEEGNIFPDSKLKEVIDSILYEERGEYVSNVGERIDFVATVVSNKEFQTQYGLSHCITMEDTAGHSYVWFTAAKSWEPGTLKHLRATVKDHTQYQGLRQTIVTRCTEVRA